MCVRVCVCVCELTCVCVYESALCVTRPQDAAERFKAEMKQTLEKVPRDRPIFKFLGIECLSNQKEGGFAEDDTVRLGEPGWKKRYYERKFGFLEGESAAEVHHVVTSYVEGLCWVMKYYYQGETSFSLSLISQS